MFFTKPSIGAEEIKRVKEVLASGQIAHGPIVRKFEEEFAKKIGVKHAVAVNSGTAALHCALYALGVKAGDEVITTPFTFAATVNAILMQGARPVFVDIDERTFNLDPRKLRGKLNKKTKAILPVDLFGLPYDPEINRIAKRSGVKVVEDAAQAHGAKLGSYYAGTLGDIGTFSFYATKNITTGEGGMIVTNNAKYAESARRFRHHGQRADRRYAYEDLGFNYRMTDMAAALGVEQLKKMSTFTRKRLENAHYLSSKLKGIDGLVTPIEPRGSRHAFHQYTLRVTPEFKLMRDKLMKRLGENGIPTAVFYPEPLHLQKYLKHLGYKKGDFPIAERMSKEVLSLPIHPLLTRKELDLIVKNITRI